MCSGGLFCRWGRGVGERFFFDQELRNAQKLPGDEMSIPTDPDQRPTLTYHYFDTLTKY